MRHAIVVLLICCLALPANAAPVSAQAAVALVKTSPQLKIDSSVPPMDAYPAKTHPYVRIAGAPEGTVGGYLDMERAHQGKLIDGTIVLAIPLDSGGSGGDFTQILFSGKSATQLSYLGYVTSGGHADVEIKSGKIVARIPQYGPNDPNCCPSTFLITTYDVVSGRLHATSHVTVPAPKRP